MSPEFNQPLKNAALFNLLRNCGVSDRKILSVVEQLISGATAEQVFGISINYECDKLSKADALKIFGNEEENYCDNCSR